ncbi:MAG TPA: hypothetical protein VEO54_10840 [Thermoanaerobaculia bacterium]|nr:hypothetical protein [Thermoanaerobaculia bacterium]
MNFERLSNVILTPRTQSSMYELVAAETKTVIETKVSGNWVHDANDSDKPMAV